MKFILQEAISKNIPTVLKQYFKKFPYSFKSVLSHLIEWCYDPSTMDAEEVSPSDLIDQRVTNGFDQLATWFDPEHEEDMPFVIIAINPKNGEWKSFRYGNPDPDMRYIKISSDPIFDKQENRYDYSADIMTNFYLGKERWKDAEAVNKGWNREVPVDKSGYRTEAEFNLKRYSKDSKRFYGKQDPQKLINSINNRIYRINSLLKQFMQDADLDSESDVDKLDAYIANYKSLRQDANEYIETLSSFDPSDQNAMNSYRKLLNFDGEFMFFYEKLFNLYKSIDRNSPTDFDW